MYTSNESPQELYLDLLKRCLTRLLFPDCCVNTQLVPTGQFDPEARRNGQDWPYEAETMIGMKRLDNVEHCVRDVLRRNVPGDLVETGVWRGGASILMRGVLKAYSDTSRSVWVVDSFEGLPVRIPISARPMQETGLPISTIIWACRSNAYRRTLNDTISWTRRFDFSKAGFGILCRRRPSAELPYCGWTEICTNPRWMPSATSTTKCRLEATLSSMITGPSPTAAQPCTISATAGVFSTRSNQLTGRASSGNVQNRLIS